MKVEDIQPGHCYARARRLLGEIELVRAEMGRNKDGRGASEVAGAAPRACYFQALALHDKLARLADEVGSHGGHGATPAPRVTDIVPGHVLHLIDAAHHHLSDVKHSLDITQEAADAPFEASRTPSDVLAVLNEASRELTQVLERPPTPSDVFRVVSLAAAYARRLSSKHVELAKFEPKRLPADCYARLGAVLELLAKRNQPGLTLRGAHTDLQPSDCFDLAYLVLGELSAAHAAANGQPVPPYELHDAGHRLPSHVHQLVRTLEAQLA
jgi:hypothetical protein